MCTGVFGAHERTNAAVLGRICGVATSLNAAPPAREEGTPPGPT